MIINNYYDNNASEFCILFGWYRLASWSWYHHTRPLHFGYYVPGLHSPNSILPAPRPCTAHHIQFPCSVVSTLAPVGCTVYRCPLTFAPILRGYTPVMSVYIHPCILSWGPVSPEAAGWGKIQDWGTAYRNANRKKLVNDLIIPIVKLLGFKHTYINIY